jgi:hypothetical protein
MRAACSRHLEAPEAVRPPGAKLNRRNSCHAVPAHEVQRSLELLQVSEVTGLVDLKQAYHERIRQLHPDVNRARDTTDEAAAVNAAYATLCQVLAFSQCTCTPAKGCADLYDAI